MLGICGICTCLCGLRVYPLFIVLSACDRSLETCVSKTEIYVGPDLRDLHDLETNGSIHEMKVQCMR